MPIATSLKHYLSKHGVKYDTVTHQHTGSSMQTAEAAHVPGDQLAKTVVLKDDQGYLMAIIPSTHHLDVEKLNAWLHRNADLVAEKDLAGLFEDCEPGAVPPVGAVYHMQAALDESLVSQPDIYFEAGDHCELIHVSGDQFKAMQGQAQCGRFSYHV